VAPLPPPFLKRPQRAANAEEKACASASYIRLGVVRVPLSPKVRLPNMTPTFHPTLEPRYGQKNGNYQQCRKKTGKTVKIKLAFKRLGGIREDYEFESHRNPILCREP
jgi:hypothetical protein